MKVFLLDEGSQNFIKIDYFCGCSIRKTRNNLFYFYCIKKNLQDLEVYAYNYQIDFIFYPYLNRLKCVIIFIKMGCMMPQPTTIQQTQKIEFKMPTLKAPEVPVNK